LIEKAANGRLFYALKIILMDYQAYKVTAARFILKKSCNNVIQAIDKNDLFLN